MGSMDGWDMALLAVGGYVALVALVRLMIRRRDQMMDEFRHEVKREKRRRAADQRKEEAERRRAA